MKKIIFSGVLALFFATSANAAKLIAGNNGPTEEQACNRAKEAVALQLEAKGKSVKRYGECSCFQKSTFIWGCKAEGFYDDESASTSSSVENTAGNMEAK